MNKILRCQFGSHVYGTNLPTSDLDYKSIFLPDARSILLQRAPESSHEGSTKTNQNIKNQPGDVDEESFSLQKYLHLLCEGQTVALDMLFVPENFILQSSEVWRQIVTNRSKFLHKGTTAFVGYTKAQAAKYGVKGFRVSALRQAISMLIGLNPGLKARLSLCEQELREGVARIANEHVSMVEIVGAKPGTKESALCVCDRKIPLHATVEYAIDVLEQIFENYGHRARMAEKNEGIDWKALMHAVRVAHEAEELLLSGSITFPRPEKDLLLQIRKAELPYQKVSEIIEAGLIKVEEAKLKSTLPEQPDRAWVDDFVVEYYGLGVSNYLYKSGILDRRPGSM